MVTAAAQVPADPKASPSAPSVPPKPPAQRAPTPEDARYAAIRALLRQQQFSDAQAVAETILSERPQEWRAQFFAGLALHKQKSYGKARPLLEAASMHETEFAEGLHAVHFLGWCAYYLGDLESAKRAFLTHQQRFPSYDDSFFALGLIALDEDHLAEAEAYFRRAMDEIAKAGGLPRERGKNLARLGDTLLRQERLAEAEAAYREAVALWRDHHEAWAKLARILDRTGRPEEAATARIQQQAALDRLSAEGIPWRP
jgi:tetratricopeptide (TPR) repeat protein